MDGALFTGWTRIPPLSRRPPGVFDKLAREKQLRARFTPKDRIFTTVNLKVVKRRCLQGGRAAGAAEKPFLEDCEFRIAKCGELICKRVLVQVAEDKTLTRLFW